MSTPMIAVVDNDPAVRESLRGLLRAAGHTVETFGAALALLDSGDLARFGCLVVDVCMPNMNGREFQSRLAASAHAELPVIFITARPDEIMKKRLFDGGAHAYFMKPFDDDALLEAIARALGRAR